jgi:hypothetical protein
MQSNFHVEEIIIVKLLHLEVVPTAGRSLSCQAPGVATLCGATLLAQGTSMPPSAITAAPLVLLFFLHTGVTLLHPAMTANSLQTG